jgi:hypothetical protein
MQNLHDSSVVFHALSASSCISGAWISFSRHLPDKASTSEMSRSKSENNSGLEVDESVKGKKQLPSWFIIFIC